jgi:hypothetical protein
MSIELELVSAEEERFSVMALKDALRDHRIHMVFQGMFSQDILTLIGLSLRKQPNNEVLSRRLFALVIEMSQNIYHYSTRKVYSEKDKRYIGTGIIGLGENDEYHLLVSGNYMDTSKTQALLDRSGYINELDDMGLKKYYQEQRKKPRTDGMPGANLGLIDMRRKSNNLIGVHILKIDDKDSFFVLTLKIRKE